MYFPFLALLLLQSIYLLDDPPFFPVSKSPLQPTGVEEEKNPENKLDSHH
jgi:hypothetical protein